MRIVEIEVLDNGAHRNQTGIFTTVPNGWAVIPENMTCENFPFGEVIVEEIDGVMTVIKWIAGVIPVPSEPSPIEKREAAYNTERVVEWDGDLLTVTEAATLWSYYAAEGSSHADELTVLIADAKAKIREQYPNREVAE